MQPLQSGSTMKLGDRPSAAPSAVTQHGAPRAPAAFPLVGHPAALTPTGVPRRRVERSQGHRPLLQAQLVPSPLWSMSQAGGGSTFCPWREALLCSAPPSPGPSILSDCEQEAPARPWRGLQVLPGLREGQGARALPGAWPASSRRSCSSCPSLGLLQPQPLHRGPWVHLPPALLPG